MTPSCPPCPHPPRAPSRGLTLIEVLVALAVVAITLAAGLKAAGALANNTDRFADVMAAQWCADNELTALKLSKQFPGVGDGEFHCDQAGRSYTGKRIVRPTPNPNFRRIDIRMLNEAGLPLLTESTILSRF
jgi:general secretion pathway protein I